MLKPIDKTNWDFGRAAHLLNRAGFGGTPEEIDKLVALGPQQAVSSLVNYEQTGESRSDPDWAKPDPGLAARLLAMRGMDPDKRKTMQQEEQKTQRDRALELKHWWLDRMANGTRPLQEKMTLFWHGHFATSEEKVRDAYLMWRQNDLFRRMATGNWYDLLVAMSTDPAMLVWLDQTQSRKEHPNENFARELMELFTLGEGHYTERDVTEGARALTGWTYDRQNQQFVARPMLHDAGVKTFLGRSGYLNGLDVLQQIVQQPQDAVFITGKIWNFFAGEMPSAQLNAALAAKLRSVNLNFKPLLTAMFLSEEFYADSIIRNQVKSPVQWLVESVRVLQRPLPAAQVCLAMTRSLGQDLFAPPNVKGWDGGLSWITTNNLLARYNYAAFLAQGDTTVMRGVNLGGAGGGAMQGENRGGIARAPMADVSEILTLEERTDREKLLAALERRLLQGKLREKQEQTLKEYLASQQMLTPEVIRNTIRLVMSTPEYQLT